MAQITEALAKDIASGSGYTDNEVMQLAHLFVANRAENAALKEDVAHWRYQADEAGHTRVLLGNNIAASQAREAQVQHLMKQHIRFAGHGSGYIEEAIAIQSDDTALREYGAKLVERIYKSGMITQYDLDELINKIRKGEF